MKRSTSDGLKMAAVRSNYAAGLYSVAKAGWAVGKWHFSSNVTAEQSVTHQLWDSILVTPRPEHYNECERSSRNHPVGSLRPNSSASAASATGRTKPFASSITAEASKRPRGPAGQYHNFRPLPSPQEHRR